MKYLFFTGNYKGFGASARNPARFSIQVLLIAFLPLLFATCAKVNVFQEPPDFPVIDSIAPSSGKIGTQIRLYGTGFSTSPSQNRVQVNNVAVRVDSPSSSTVILVTITSNTGTGKVNVKVNEREGTGPVFTYDEHAVSLNSLTPSTGWTDTLVVLRGVGFGMSKDSATVRFNANIVAILGFSDTLIRVRAPAPDGPGTSVSQVTVKVSGKTSNALPFTYSNQQKPVIGNVLNQAKWLGFYYWVSVSGLSSQTASNKISANGHDVAIDSILREGTDEYNQFPYGEKLVLKRENVDQYLINNGVDFMVTANDLSSDIFHFQNKPEITNITARGRVPYHIALDDTVTISGNYFGSLQQASVVEIWFNNNGSLVQTNPDPEILSWNNTEIKIIIPSRGYLMPDGTALSLYVKQGDQTAMAAVIYVIPGVQDPGSVTVSTLAGNGAIGFQDGNGANAEFNSPNGISVDSHGNIYVADTENDRIRKIAPDGSTVSTLTGFVPPSYEFGEQNGIFSIAVFDQPIGLISDASDNIFCLSQGGHHFIRKIDLNAGLVSNYPGSPYTGLIEPEAVIFDREGNFYISDYALSTIFKLSPSGETTVLAGSNTYDRGYADGTGTAALFNHPMGLAADAQGNIYVADADNFRIRKITPAGVVSTFAGNGGNENIDGQGISASIAFPIGLTIDSTGNLYVAASDGIMKITPSGMVSTIAGGTAGYRDGDGKTAQFFGMHGITIDQAGTLYVCDSGNQRIRKITFH